MVDIIQEYLVKIGFTTDKKTGENAEKDVNSLFDTIQKMFEKLLKNLGLDLDQWMKTTGGDLDKGAKSIKTHVSGLQLFITEAALAVGGVIILLLKKVMDDSARADLQVQLFARRLFTSVENARSLQAVMKAMGVQNIEQLNDIALNPELRNQFLELRRVANSLQFGKDQREGLKGVRALNLEFQKLGLIIEAFWNRLGADFAIVLNGPLKDVQNWMKNINQFLIDIVPNATRNIAAFVGIISDLLTLFNQIGRLLGEIEAQIPFAKDFFKGLGDVLSDILPLIHILLQGLNNSINKIHGTDILNLGNDLYKNREALFGKVAEYAQKIFELISRIWSEASGPFKDLNQKFDSFRKGAGDVAKNITESAGQAVKEIIKTPEKILNAVTPRAEASMLPVTGRGHGRLNWATNDPSTKAIDGFIERLNQNLNGNYAVTAAFAKKGHVSHGDGRTFDVGLGGKSDAQIVSLLRSVIATPGLKRANLELAPVHYSRIIKQLKQERIDTSKVTGYHSRFSHGDHLDVKVNPNIVINVNGAGDPHAVANAVRNRLQDINAFTTRNTQGAFA